MAETTAGRRPGAIGRLRGWIGASLHRQLILSLVCVHALLATVFVFDVIARESAALDRMRLERAQGVAEMLARLGAEPAAVSNAAGLAQVAQTAQAFSGVRFALFVDPAGRVLTGFERLPGSAPDSLAGSPLLSRVPALRNLRTDATTEAAAPVTVDGRVVGWAVANLSRADVEATLDHQFWRGTLYVVAATIAAAALGFLIAGRLSRGLAELAAVSARFRHGDHAVRVKRNQADEVGAVGRGLNAMLDTLAESERSLRSARDQAEAANLAKSEFLATMSHEIRTPLNGVLGMAQAMQTEPLSPTQREKLKVIRQSGQTLLALLNDILDLAKIESGKLAIEAVEFDLEHTVRGALATFATLAQSKGVSFGLTIDEEAAGRYCGDPVRIRQILYNLAGNAVKFTNGGGVRVYVRYEAGTLVAEVVDTGVGIAPEKVATLFDKFVQADASTTRRFGGSGLGLAICRQLTELMGGTIEVSSALGEGSAFTVRLPLERVADVTPIQVESAVTPRASPPEPSTLRILAAEDNEVNQLVLRALLAPAGVELEVVANGAEAVDAWERQAWDVVLLDVQMPVMDGPTAARTIRAREVELGRPRTPIVGVTANAMAHHLAEYAACGMDDVVTKPIQVDRLFAAVDGALAASEAVALQAAS